MEDEKIILKEAASFYERELEDSRNQAIDSIHVLKSRLYDFYLPQYKAIFLNEVHRIILEKLQEHRDKAHAGLPKEGCQYEEQAEKLSFYIKQEIGILPAIAHKHIVEKPKYVRTKVFVSYSHYDKEYLTDLKRHFKPFLKDIDFWDDTKIQPSQKWKEEIITAINETKVAILLVSADFLGSSFISTDELPPLLKAADEDGASILIVILKPVLFEEFPELNIYQAMNQPSRPVIKMEYAEKEDLWVNLVRQTKSILKK